MSVDSGSLKLMSVVVAGLVAVELAGCGASDSSDSGRDDRRGVDVSMDLSKQPNLSKYYDQKVNWGSCVNSSEAAEADPLAGMQCGAISVPLAYPDTAKADKGAGIPVSDDGKPSEVSIAVSRIPASSERRGTLIVNPGGPGASGRETPSLIKDAAARTGLSASYDIVGFDPRGVGASTPAIVCSSAEQIEAKRADPGLMATPEQVAMTDKVNQDFADGCVKNMGEAFLGHVGTREVVRDLDVLRSAVGDPALNFLGFSYGTKIASEYAQRFPSHVRTMVFDGVAAVNETASEGNIKQAASFENTFHQYARDCASKPECPLGTDPAQADAEYQKLVRPLIETPAKSNERLGRRPVSYYDATLGTLQALYSSENWAALTIGLTALKNDNDGGVLLLLADLYLGRNEDGSYANSSDAQKVINCMDNRESQTDHERIDTARAADAAAPFISTDAPVNGAPHDVCSLLPVPATSAPHEVSAAGLPKTVVVSTVNDPATPYAAGKHLADVLGADLITFDGNQHTVAMQDSSPCIDDAIAAYITDLAAPSTITCPKK